LVVPGLVLVLTGIVVRGVVVRGGMTGDRNVRASVGDTDRRPRLGPPCGLVLC
jgi:hypothetical protein